MLLSGEEPATPVRAARPQWTESLDPEAAESQELIRRLCGELPVRTIAAPAQAHAEVRELERWLWDSQPMVSVVIPVHNGARFLRRSISSIIGQRGARFQLIAVDDGSTDSSLSVLVALLPEVVDAGHELIITSHAQEQGADAARNTGIAAARGAYVAFLDQQDEWLPGRTEVMLCAARRDERPAVLGSMELLSDQEDLPDWARPEWFGDGRRGSVAGAMLLRRSALNGAAGMVEGSGNVVE